MLLLWSELQGYDVLSVRAERAGWPFLRLGRCACLTVSMINKTLSSVPGQPGPTPQPSTTATLCLPISGTCGQPFLERMSASAGAAAKDGIQLAGQTFDGTSEGVPVCRQGGPRAADGCSSRMLPCRDYGLQRCSACRVGGHCVHSGSTLGIQV